MKKYEVTVTQTDIYRVIVEAESEDEAVNRAQEEIVNAEDQDVFFSHVEDRDYNAAEATP